MKKIVAAILSLMTLLLISCKIWGEDSDVGGQTCDRYDQALDVGFATTSTVDSVQFFMNGIQVCISHEMFRDNRGSQGFQGHYGHTNYELCNQICRSSSDFIVMNVFGCRIGTVCDKFEGELNDFVIKVYTDGISNSIQLTTNSLPQLGYNKAFRIIPKFDSLSTFYLEADNFRPTGCQDEYCISELLSNSLLCIDSYSDTPKKEFKNTCEEWSFFDY